MVDLGPGPSVWAHHIPLPCPCPVSPTELLLAIHDEVLAGVAQRLPAEMQVLNAVLQAPSG